MSEQAGAWPPGKAPVTVLDLRTSSFDAAAGVVTEITAIRFAANRDEEGAPFEWHLPEELAGGTDDDARRRQTEAFSPVWAELATYLSPTLVIAHGAAWTRTFLKKAALEADSAWAQPAFLCTRRMARSVFPDLQSYRLDALIVEIGLEPAEPSGGQERCRVVADLYGHCLRRLGFSDRVDLADLAAFLTGGDATIDRGPGPR